MIFFILKSLACLYHNLSIWVCLSVCCNALPAWRFAATFYLMLQHVQVCQWSFQQLLFYFGCRNSLKLLSRQQKLGLQKLDSVITDKDVPHEWTYDAAPWNIFWDSFLCRYLHIQDNKTIFIFKTISFWIEPAVDCQNQLSMALWQTMPKVPSMFNRTVLVL